MLKFEDKYQISVSKKFEKNCLIKIYTLMYLWDNKKGFKFWKWDKTRNIITANNIKCLLRGH